PRQVDAARKTIARANLQDRCDVAVCDFLRDDVPAGGDLYVLSWILHDWDDEPALHILRNCRRAMPEHARLLVIEHPIDDAASHFREVVMEAISIMLMCGGRERTEVEYRSLLEQSRLRLTRVLLTTSPIPGHVPKTVFEAVPVDR